MPDQASRTWRRERTSPLYWEIASRISSATATNTKIASILSPSAPEMLPASLDLEKAPDHVLTVFARWQRFEKLKASATTLQHLESTIDLAYFDFRPDTGTFCPSLQLREVIGQREPTDAMAPWPTLWRCRFRTRFPAA